MGVKIGLVYLTRSSDFEDLKASVQRNQECFGDQLAWILTLHTDSSPDSRPYVLSEVEQYWHPCGSGFDKSLADGGFDEITARHRMLGLAERTCRSRPVDWVVWCDSDEYFCRRDALVSPGDEAELLLFTTNHLRSLILDLAIPFASELFTANAVPRAWAETNNPHPRAARPAVLHRLWWRKNWHLPATAANATQHCVLTVKAGRPVRTHVNHTAHVHFGTLNDARIHEGVLLQESHPYASLNPQVAPPYLLDYTGPGSPRRVVFPESAGVLI